jgi:ribosomal protein S18 acetylase RimI-like enzyme
LRLIIQQPEFGQILVIRDGTTVVGMLNLLFTISASQGGQTVLLEDLIVHPSHRRLGIALILLRHAIALAHSRGASHITLLADRSNQLAIQFYQSHGFNLCRYEVSRLPLVG